jgi:transposase
MNPVFAGGNHKTVAQLERLHREARAEKAPRVAERIRAISLSIRRYTAPEIAEILGVSRTTVPLWIAQWNAGGVDSLLEGFRSGRPCELSEEQMTILYDIIESGPAAYGLDCGVWTSPIVTRLIEDEFLIVYHPGHVRKLLHKLGFSVQRPTYKLANADTKERNRWIRYTYPKLKKTPARKALQSFMKTKQASGNPQPSTKRGRH